MMSHSSHTSHTRHTGHSRHSRRSPGGGDGGVGEEAEEERMPVLQLELPLPPSANRYWRSYRGRVVRSREADDYIRDVAAHVLAQCRGQRPAILPGTPVCFRVDVSCLRQRDLTNCLKVLEDALAQALGFDDRWTDQVVLTKHTVRHRRECRVQVAVLWGEDALPWHCAWCTPPPSLHATSGICAHHYAVLMAAMADAHSAAACPGRETDYEAG